MQINSFFMTFLVGFQLFAFPSMAKPSIEASIPRGPESFECTLAKKDAVDNQNFSELFDGNATYGKIVSSFKGSAEFKAVSQEARNNGVKLVGKPRVGIINSGDEGRNFAVVSYKVEGDATNGLAIVNMIVDYVNKTVVSVDKYYALQVSSDLVNLKLVRDGVVTLNANIDKDGTITPIVGGVQQGVRQAGSAVCVYAMAILCGAGGGWACYALCGVTAIINVLGAVGCAIACGVIASVGCTAATNRICK